MSVYNNEELIEQGSEDVTLPSKNSSPNKNNQKFRVGRTFWDRIPKYKWWVTPLNILLIGIFLVVIDVITLPNTGFLRIDWAWWPIGGMFFAYIVSFIIFKRPEIAWIVGPILMVGASGLLLAIDLVFPPNDGFLGMDWAIIPIAALLTFGVLIPIVTKFGRKKEKPIDKFRKAVAEMKKQEEQDTS